MVKAYPVARRTGLISLDMSGSKYHASVAPPAMKTCTDTKRLWLCQFGIIIIFLSELGLLARLMNESSGNARAAAPPTVQYNACKAAEKVLLAILKTAGRRQGRGKEEFNTHGRIWNIFKLVKATQRVTLRQGCSDQQGAVATYCCHQRTASYVAAQAGLLSGQEDSEMLVSWISDALQKTACKYPCLGCRTSHQIDNQPRHRVKSSILLYYHTCIHAYSTDIPYYSVCSSFTSSARLRSMPLANHIR